MVKRSLYRRFFKRLFDLVLSFLLLIMASPLLLLCWIGLLVVNKGKPFFLQLRPGKDGHVFYIIKFKTMNDKRDEASELLPDTERLTGLGKWVRKTSLDELPQLINVLKGDMSLIGPRPLLVEYLPLYSPEQARRHEVRPGITGWAQVNGRNAISWEEKFIFDVYYVDNLSFALDLKIFRMTLWNVIQGKGISQEGQVTMEKFIGNN